MDYMRNIIDQFFNGTDNPNYRRIVRWMWYLTFAGIISVILVFVALSFTDLPSVEQLENPRSEEATQIYASNGEVLGRYYLENRVPVTFDQLDKDLVNALIATEDERYYQHSGIDFQALGRVAVKTVLLGQESSGGASTITQQLAKLLFTGQRATNMPKRVIQKLKEWIIAVRLERRYTKEEIIAMYLNKFEFLYQSYGIKAAAETYFDTSQDSLRIQEAAMLIGMLKNPSFYNPLTRPELANQRRNVVLKQMEKNELLSETEYDSLKTLPLGLRYTRKSHIDGIATYFRAELAKDVKEILNRPENRKSDGSAYNIYTDGLKIYTTIDPQLQKIAEEEMMNHMAGLQKDLAKEWGRYDRDPWTYKTGSDKEMPVELRQETLQRLIRETERYQKMREHYLSDITESIEKRFEGFEFHVDDREIVRMVNEQKEPGFLANMLSLGYISSEQVAEYRRIMNSEFFPTLTTQWQALQDKVEENFGTPTEMRVFTYETENLEKDTVLTPLDSIKYHRFFFQTGILAVEPITGHVKVWIGGINHKYFQYDHVRTYRQVGSTFKPFIYATAIDRLGFSPCYQVYDWARTITPGDGSFGLLDKWTPENFTGRYSGELYNLKQALRQSVNTVSVYLMKQIGDTQPVRSLVHNMGIDTSARYANGRLRVPRVPSICLGATDLTVMQMTGAYTTFANNGYHNKPTYILRIEDKNGRLIFEEMPEERAALPPNANYVMVEMLRYAATGMYGLKSDIGGKTGTTNDYVDGWFMGVTPNLVVGTWVGAEDRWIHFLSPSRGQGAYMAKPFFKAFIKRLEESESADYDPSTRFQRPAGDLGIELDCSEYDNTAPGMDMEDKFEEDVFSEDMFGDEAFRQQREPQSENNQQQQQQQ